MKHQPKFEGARVEWPESVTHLMPEPIGPQEIFDRVVAHYRQQPRQCTGPAGGCAYRNGPEACFGGALIDDAHYHLEMEGYPIRALLRLFPMPAWFRENIDLIQDLQKIHDDWRNWGAVPRMEMVLELFAVERGLVLNP